MAINHSWLFTCHAWVLCARTVAVACTSKKYQVFAQTLKNGWQTAMLWCVRLQTCATSQLIDAAKLHTAGADCQQVGATEPRCLMGSAYEVLHASYLVACIILCGCTSALVCQQPGHAKVQIIRYKTAATMASSQTALVCKSHQGMFPNTCRVN